jgi:hypothetical protein
MAPQPPPYPPYPPPVPQPPAAPRDGIGRGILFALLVDLGLFVMVGLAAPAGLFAFGLIEWIGLLPLFFVFRGNGQRLAAKGVLIIGGIVFLLQAACYGIVLLIMGGTSFH